MRILHVMDHSLPRVGGYTIRAKYLLEAQAASGHQVTVLTSPSQGRGATDDVGPVTYLRTAYTPLEERLAAVGGKQAVFGRAVGRRVRQLLDGGGFDMVHAHTPFTVARAALREARRAGLPCVYEKRNLWEESARARGKVTGRWPLYQVAQAVDRAVTRGADAVLTITESLKAHSVRLGAAPDRVFVVGNGVDGARFLPRDPSPDLRARCARGGSFVVGFVGSFFSFEGLPLLVDAFAELRRTHPQARLVLVGDGEDRPLLERMLARGEAAEGVWLAGTVPHDEVLDYYAAMDVLVYPRYRSLLTEMISPLKPLEAMAMERCVVGSDVGGLRDLIRDGETGVLFTAGSREDLAARLRQLADGQIDRRALAAEARRHVLAHRQWTQMAGTYEEAYRRVLGPA